jgi:hypothetical protein
VHAKPSKVHGVIILSPAQSKIYQPLIKTISMHRLGKRGTVQHYIRPRDSIPRSNNR